MREESAGQELKMREVDTRIEREIAELRTAIQASKATTLQYVVGFGEFFFCLQGIAVYIDVNANTYYSNWLLCLINGLPPFPSMIILYNIFGN